MSITTFENNEESNDTKDLKNYQVVTLFIQNCLLNIVDVMKSIFSEMCQAYLSGIGDSHNLSALATILAHCIKLYTRPLKKSAN
jgi:hypothetical protein